MSQGIFTISVILNWPKKGSILPLTTPRPNVFLILVEMGLTIL